MKHVNAGPPETYPMVAILVAAAKATSEPRDGSARQKERKAPSQIVRVGALNLLSICAKNRGIPPSRANANIIREFEVRLKSPAKKTHMMMRQKSTTAPSGPKTSTNIWRTGLPYSLSRVRSKSWIEKRKASMMKNPNSDENPTEEMTPMGADQDAFLVSSDK